MKTLRQFFLLMGLILSSVTFALSYQDATELGKTAFQRGDSQLAIQHLTKALTRMSSQNKPTDYIDVSVNLAQAYHSSKNIKATCENLAVAKDIANKANSQKIDEIRHEGVIDQLKEATQKVLPDILNLGKEAFQKGQFQQAIQCWEVALSHFSPLEESEKYVDTSLRLAVAYLSSGYLHKSHEILQRIQIEVPELSNQQKAFILLYLSDVYVAGRDLKEGSLDCDIETATDDGNPEIMTKQQFSSFSRTIEKAKYYLKEALRLVEKKIGSFSKIGHYLKAHILNRQANILSLEAMHAKERQDSNADDYYKSAIIRYCDSVNLTNSALPTYCQKILDATCEYQKNTDKAYQTYQSFTCPPSFQNHPLNEEITANNVLSAKSLTNLIKTIVQYDEFQYPILGLFPSDVKGEDILNDELEIVQEKGNQVAKRHNQSIYWQVKQLPGSRDKTFAFLSLAKLIFSSNFAKNREIERQSYVYYALKEAENIAKTQDDKLAMAYVNFYLAQIYEKKGRDEEALKLIKYAISHAQNYSFPFDVKQQTVGIQHEFLGSPELLFQLKWQLGKLLRKRSSVTEKESICTDMLEKNYQPFETVEKACQVAATYQHAENYLKIIRRGYRGLSQNFRRDIENFYFDWADFFLQQAKANEQQDEGLLAEILEEKAIEKVELSKIAEIRNYFHDECVIAKEVEEKVRTLSQTFKDNVALFYPLIFEDGRINLLLRSKQEIKQFPIITGKKVEQVVNDFRQELQMPGKDFNKGKQYAQTLYNWLIKPIINELDNQKEIDTLVIVPHGILRTIPFAALYDNDKEEYLVQKYALAVIPSLNLTDLTPPILNQRSQTLLTGLSAKSKIPNNFNPLCYVPREIRQISCLLKDNGNVLNDQSFDNCLKFKEKRCYDDSKNNLYSIKSSTNLVQCLKRTGIHCALGKDESYASPWKAEIDILQDEDFTFSNVEKRLHQIPYTIIHFSTHGAFGNRPDNTYLLAYDSKITMDDLKSLVGITKDGPQPIELLTLSACETAKGDKRSALGLAGVAIKAGVPSILATLWNVNEISTAKLMVEFYRQLTNKEKSLSKAKALQEAQLWWLLRGGAEENKNELSGDPKHPSYWAPFLLIGNWY